MADNSADKNFSHLEIVVKMARRRGRTVPVSIIVDDLMMFGKSKVAEVSEDWMGIWTAKMYETKEVIEADSKEAILEKVAEAYKKTDKYFEVYGE